MFRGIKRVNSLLIQSFWNRSQQLFFVSMNTYPITVIKVFESIECNILL